MATRTTTAAAAAVTITAEVTVRKSAAFSFFFFFLRNASRRSVLHWAMRVLSANDARTVESASGCSKRLPDERTNRRRDEEREEVLEQQQSKGHNERTVTGKIPKISTSNVIFELFPQFNLHPVWFLVKCSSRFSSVSIRFHDETEKWFAHHNLSCFHLPKIYCYPNQREKIDGCFSFFFTRLHLTFAWKWSINECCYSFFFFLLLLLLSVYFSQYCATKI